MAIAQAPSAATRRAREVVALINEATPPAIRAYVDSAFDDAMRGLPMQAHIDFFLGNKDESHGLEWIDVQEGAHGETTALLKRKLTAELLAMVVRSETTPPYRIGAIGRRPPRATAGAAEPRMTSDAEMATALERYVTTLATADLFSGAVLLAKNGQPIYAGVFGEANKDFGVPNKIDTKFTSIMSVSIWPRLRR